MHGTRGGGVGVGGGGMGVVTTPNSNGGRTIPTSVTSSSLSSKSQSSVTQSPLSTTTISANELIKREFYATYDVMTGIRIAATLGGFFGLVVILVVYKSKSKTEKALNDPYLAAVAAEAVAEAEADLQEEEMALQAALEATAAWSCNPRASRTARQSLGNMSAPTMWAHSPRFSSVGGGYANLLTPPTRAQTYGPKSLPGSALRFHTQPSCKELDDDDDDDDDADHDRGGGADDDAFDEFDDDFQFLNVNKRNYRRCSNITCSSSDSSYLERRGSAVVGLPPPPALPTSRRRSSAEKCWDFYYPIDIQVIQPTPDMSPSSSERCVLYDTVPGGGAMTDVNRLQAANLTVTGSSSSGLVVPSRLAPLATISSCASSVLGTELDQRSELGSDSVFMDDDNYCYDTDDEVTQFSTDSSEENLITTDLQLQEYSGRQLQPSLKRQHSWKRRASAPLQRRKSITQQQQQRLMKNAESINLLNNGRSDSLKLISKSSENIQLRLSSTRRLNTNSGNLLNRIAETSLLNNRVAVATVSNNDFKPNTSITTPVKIAQRPPYPLPSQCTIDASSTNVSDTSTLVATTSHLSDDNTTQSCSLNMPPTLYMVSSPSTTSSQQKMNKNKKSSSLVNIELGASQETLF
ncbi:uncharacterized protein LOC123297942 [Chrysoperla carnea]|uniref:uncharacterized protein LOC123297942 n=1 Tax=Chrysoperla carnea TaxID=189513 RepID=UPI001D0896EC|nr:uncharacterized protein LOC123297942 [Chrysoperla carnea]